MGPDSQTAHNIKLAEAHAAMNALLLLIAGEPWLWEAKPALHL
jgi:hypothetical protein